MIHHSNITCDECGKRHTPGNPTECITGLLDDLARGRVDRGCLERLLAAAEVERQRLRDLCWHQRAELYAAGLISGQEYTALAADVEAVVRLKSYAAEKAAREKAERALTEADLQWTKINLDLSVAVTDARDYATQTKQECDHSVIEERQLRTHTERELAIEKAAHTEDQERLDALECLVLAGYDVTADVESGTLYVFIQTDGSESAPIYRGVGNLRAAIDAALAEWRKERDAPQA